MGMLSAIEKIGFLRRGGCFEDWTLEKRDYHFQQAQKKIEELGEEAVPDSLKALDDWYKDMTDQIEGKHTEKEAFFGHKMIGYPMIFRRRRPSAITPDDEGGKA